MAVMLFRRELARIILQPPERHRSHLHCMRLQTAFLFAQSREQIHGWTGGHAPLLFEAKGSPVLCPPGVEIKTVVTKCQILRLKCTKFNFGCGSIPYAAGGADIAPPARTLAGFNGTYF